MRPSRIAPVLGCLVVTLAAAPVFARCEPTAEPDRSDVAAARAAVEANCDCAAAGDHGAYVRCARDQIHASLANRDCRRMLRGCAAHSTCGRPGSVTCCRRKAGKTKCKIARSAEACEAKGGVPYPCGINPCIDPIFGSTDASAPTNWYWSSATYAGFPTAAWSVLFGNGQVDASGKLASQPVRAVRGP